VRKAAPRARKQRVLIDKCYFKDLQRRPDVKIAELERLLG
jgi:hypothetical protein